MLEQYPGKVRVVYKHYIVHPDAATVPALASCAAAAQNRFGDMEKLIWDKGFAERDLSPDKMLALATELELDLAKFEADMAGEACQARIIADQEELARFGVSGTPGFFINGRFLGGAQPLPAFVRLVDEELAKAEARIAAGTPAAEYYERVVMAEGLPSVDAR